MNDRYNSKDNAINRKRTNPAPSIQVFSVLAIKATIIMSPYRRSIEIWRKKFNPVKVVGGRIIEKNSRLDHFFYLVAFYLFKIFFFLCISRRI